MIAILFGTYNSKHAANALLLADLRAAGFEVRECHEPLWEETRDKNAPYFAPAGLLRLGLRYFAAALRLTRSFRRAREGADLVVAGFNGQLDVVLARALARGRRVLFAPLVTISETLVDDRGTYVSGSLAARLLRALDRASLGAADLVLIDTAAHRDYLVERLGIAPARVAVQYLGAEPTFAPGATAARVEEGDLDPPRRAHVEAAARRTATPQGPCAAAPRLRVLCYSQYLPLHGGEVVAAAARILGAGSGVEFELIGTGPERARCDELVRGLAHVHQLDWVPYAELPARIRAADVVLGIFGTSAKARMVVPNKVYQAAQVGSAIVTADTPAIHEVFVDGESVRVVAPEPQALADALLALAGDPALRVRLARGSRAAVARVAAPEVRAARLRAALAARSLPSGGALSDAERA